jgi:hypothetical protein
MNLNFREWFGHAILDDPEPASEIPYKLNKGANPLCDLSPLPGNKPRKDDPLLSAINAHLKPKRQKKN